MAAADAFRALPSVDELLQRLARLSDRYPRALVTAEIRRALERSRTSIRAGAAPPPLEASVEAALDALARPSMRRVINATGVVLHTNLGRAPLETSPPASGYSNLEYDLAAGKRGKRDVHPGPALERLLGAPAIAVNNNAAAVYLVLAALAAGGEVIVSRGELIEIGDGFRIPEIMQASGAVLVETGTTNRTHLDDYRRAITDRTRLILRVHPSNFRIEGFTARPSLRELTGLSRERGIPVYEDLGSGCLVDLRAYGVEEPLAAESLAAGVNLISFSGDKLLGGPQAGLIAGDAALVEKVRRHPMYRALRLDKLVLHALEETARRLLLEQYDAIPALRMIRMSAESIRERAEQFAARIGGAEVIEGQSVIGGGATPGQPLRTFLVAIEGDAVRLEKRLRDGDPPVIARIEDDRVVLDLRTVFDSELEDLYRAAYLARS